MTPEELQAIRERAEGGFYVQQRVAEADASALLAEVERLNTQLDKVRALVADFNANGNSRELYDPTGDAWHQAALKLLQALDGSDQ